MAPPPILPVIMCGGIGSRLWPLSREASPKQLLPLVTERSMLAETALRMVDSEAPDRFAPPVLVIGQDYADAAVRNLAGLVPGVRAIVEPAGRNTAPCAALACHAALERDPDTIVALLAADHHIADAPAFRAALAKAADLARTGRIVTLGIEPTEPATGFGYIRRGEPMGEGFAVAQFVEKPDLARAEAMLAEGGYFWNAGVFIFRADVMLSELNRHAPAVADAVARAWKGSRRQGAFVYPDATAWADCPSISVDYAVAEKTDRAAVVPFGAGWSDVGSWLALWDIAGKDEDGNAAQGDVMLIDARGSYVRAESRLVTVVGVDNLVVVETADAVLVMPKDRVQDVKLVIDRLNRDGRPETRR